MAMAAAASSSSSSLLGVYPPINPNQKLTHQPPISHLRFSHNKSLPLMSGRVQLKRVMAAASTKLETTTPPSVSSSSVTTTVEVDLGDRSYPIYIGSGLLQQPHLLQRSPSYTPFYFTFFFFFHFSIHHTLLPLNIKGT